MSRKLGAVLAQLGNSDLRAYWAYAVRHPLSLKRERPRFGGRPPYLATARPAGALLPRAPLPALLAWGGREEAGERLELDLAGARVSASSPEAIPWSRGFEDLEQESALHRFSWLLPLMVSWSGQGRSCDQAWDLFTRAAAGWIGGHATPDASEAWHPYAVSERCVNWILACLACGRNPADSALAHSLSRQIGYLAGNLEYNGESLTGNHLSNNGRALYLAGCALDKESWRQAGLEILLRESRRLFVEPRFLREGSTHYQFLVARNYCEALWFASRFGDAAAVQELTPIVGALGEGCRFFLARGEGGWTFPLLGDISPDCPPSWLLGVPWVAESLCGRASPSIGAARGWHSLFFATGTSVADTARPAVESGREWARVSREGWDIFAHLNPAGHPLCPGHAHQDTGAIVAFFEGRPVIVSAGRRHYVDDAEGRWGKSAWSNSMLIVEGSDPAPEWRWFLAPDYLRRRTGERPEFSHYPDGVAVRHGGYARFGIGAVERRVSVKDGGVVISDSVDGSGRRRLDLVFHLSADAVLALPRDLKRVREASGSPSEYLGWRTERYGEKIPCKAVVASGRVRLPWKGDSVVRMRS